MYSGQAYKLDSYSKIRAQRSISDSVHEHEQVLKIEQKGLTEWPRCGQWLKPKSRTENLGAKAVQAARYERSCFEIGQEQHQADRHLHYASHVSVALPFKSAAINRNCSKAASKSSTISCAITSGAGRFAESVRLSSLSQKISRLALSRAMNSSYSYTRQRPSRFDSLHVYLRSRRLGEL
jgi:hypothetical protein